MENLTGQQLGAYRLQTPLGEGGMAFVYRAYQPGVERSVAVKILPRQYSRDAEFLSRFNREAKVVANLQHPHILAVFDYGQANDFTYIVMPLLEGGTLTDKLKEGPFTLDQISRVMAQVGDALDYAHAQGIVHRDIKPSNVLLDTRGNCLLSDFGIARIVEGSEALTDTGKILGTPSYMAPEQGQGHPADARSDIYALGIILYEMLTGRVPFKAETPVAIVIKHIHSPLPLPSQMNPSISPAVEEVVLKALAKKPDDRYQTATAMSQALNKAIAATPAVVPAEPSLTDMTAPSMSAVKSAPPPVIEPITANPLEERTIRSTAYPQVTQPARPQPQWLWAGVVGVVIVILLSLGWWSFSATPSIETSAPFAPTNMPLESTEFPLPQDITFFIKAPKGERITFQTGLNLVELKDFYREKFEGQGLVERRSQTTLNTMQLVITFDNPQTKKSITVDAVDFSSTQPIDKRGVTIDYLNP